MFDSEANQAKKTTFPHSIPHARSKQKCFVMAFYKWIDSTFVRCFLVVRLSVDFEGNNFVVNKTDSLLVLSDFYGFYSL